MAFFGKFYHFGGGVGGGGMAVLGVLGVGGGTYLARLEKHSHYLCLRS